MKKFAPINVITYFPKTEEGKLALAKRVAEVHADAVIRRVKALDCPDSQKHQLIDAIIATAKERAAESEASNNTYEKSHDR